MSLAWSQNSGRATKLASVKTKSGLRCSCCTIVSNFLAAPASTSSVGSSKSSAVGTRAHRRPDRYPSHSLHPLKKPRLQSLGQPLRHLRQHDPSHVVRVDQVAVQEQWASRELVGGHRKSGCHQSLGDAQQTQLEQHQPSCLEYDVPGSLVHHGRHRATEGNDMHQWHIHTICQARQGIGKIHSESIGGAALEASLNPPWSPPLSRPLSPPLKLPLTPPLSPPWSPPLSPSLSQPWSLPLSPPLSSP